MTGSHCNRLADASCQLCRPPGNAKGSIVARDAIVRDSALTGLKQITRQHSVHDMIHTIPGVGGL